MQNLNMDTIQIQVKVSESDFVVDVIQDDDSESFPIESYEFADLVIVRTEVGITLKWTEEDSGLLKILLF